MTFPTVAASSTYASSANETGATVTLPSGVVEGSKLSMFVFKDGFNNFSAEPAGWKLKFSATSQGGIGRVHIYEIVAGASESNPAFTFASDSICAIIVRWSNAGDMIYGAPDYSFGAKTPTPRTAYAEEWSGDDVTWVAVAGWDKGEALTSYPSSYGSNNITANWDDAEGGAIAIATRQLVADSEASGAFTISGTGNITWLSVMVAVRDSAAGGGGSTTYNINATNNRIVEVASGTTDYELDFFAGDSSTPTTPETGLSSFTVYRDRNGAGAAAMTTPTITEVDSSNAAGYYTLLLDEDTTIASDNDWEYQNYYITHAGMAPVHLTVKLVRPKITAGQTLSVTGGDLTNGAGESAHLLLNTTIASVTSNVQFILTAGLANDTALNGAVCIVTDASTSNQKAIGYVQGFTASTKEVILWADPLAAFTFGAGDNIKFFPNMTDPATIAAYCLQSVEAYAPQVSTTAATQYNALIEAVSMYSTSVDGTPASQTEIVFAAGPSANDALNDHWVIFQNPDTPALRAYCRIIDWVGSTLTATLETAPTYTVDDQDIVVVLPSRASTKSDKMNLIDAPNATALAAFVDAWEAQSQADPTGFHVNVKEVNGTAQTANDNGADINAILEDTGTTLDGLLNTLVRSKVMLSTTVASALGAAIELTAGSATDDFYQDRWAIFHNHTTGAFISMEKILFYNGTSRLLTLGTGTGISAGNYCTILNAMNLNSTNINSQLASVYSQIPTEAEIIAALLADGDFGSSGLLADSANSASSAATAVTQTTATAIRTAVGLESANLSSLVQAVVGKNTVTDNEDGTYDIAIRNAADDATLVTIRYTPETGEKVVV